jgi:large conductance mechanosensitive channel
MMPIASLIFPQSHTIAEVFWVARRGPNYEELHGYNTLEQAKDDGAVTIAYG